MDFVSGSRSQRPTHQVPSRLQPRERGDSGGLRHLWPVGHPHTRRRCSVSGLFMCGANRQWFRVQQPGVPGFGQQPWHPVHSDSAGASHTERLHRKLQRQVS